MQLQYRKKHKITLKIYNTNYKRKRRRKDIAFKILSNLRTRLNSALKKNFKSQKTIELLGCSAVFLKQYLEKKFKKRMNWKNYGFYGWHIDHVIPCYRFDLRKKNEQCKCFHYSNLRPLWAEENLRRSKVA